MSSGKASVEDDGFLKLVYCFPQKSRFTIGAAKDDMQLRTVAKLREHAFINLLRERKLVLLEIGKSQSVGNVIIVRCYSQRCLQLTCGLLKIPNHKMTLAEHLVGAGALRIGG